MLLKISVLVLYLAWLSHIVHSAGLRELFTWTRINYAWPENAAARIRTARRIQLLDDVSLENNGSVIIFEDNQQDSDSDKREGNFSISAALTDGTNGSGRIVNYNYVNNIPMGANVWRNKLFITVPRRRLGIPSTLNYVPLTSRVTHNVPLIPYPNWDMNLYNPTDVAENRNRIVSVYRLAIDVCDRLWFVDTGIVETLGNRTVSKPHELFIMDLKTDKIISRHPLPADVVRPATVLAQLTLDVDENKCGDAHAYFPDLAGFGMVVFSLEENRFWRVNHNYFFVEPLAGEFNVAGYTFQWNDGIFSIELSKTRSDGYRFAYFHSMAGTHIYRVSTRVLRNETLAVRSYHGDDFEIVGDRGTNSQASTCDIHKPSGVMFLGMVNQNALGCWNTNKDLRTLSIVQRNDRTMIYPSDVKVAGDNLFVLTNAMPQFIYGRLDYDQTNFRVWTNTVQGAVKGTMCQ